MQPIIVVDDDTGVRAFVRRVLEHCGYRVALAHHARQALDLITGVNGAIRLLLTDLGMPGLSGVELVRRARSLWPALPCICMTGYVEEQWALARMPDPCPVLRKPFTLDDLTATVRSTIGPP